MKNLTLRMNRLSILILLLITSLLNQVHSQHRRYSFQEGDVMEYEITEFNLEDGIAEVNQRRKFRFNVNKVEMGQFHLTMQTLNWSVPNLYSFSDQTAKLKPELRVSQQILWNFLGHVNAELNNPISFVLDSLGGIHNIKGYEKIQKEIIQAAHESDSYKYHKNFEDISIFYGRQKYHYLISEIFPAVPGSMNDTIDFVSGELEALRINHWLPQAKEHATRDQLNLNRELKFFYNGANNKLKLPQDTTNSMFLNWVENRGYPSRISYTGYPNSYFTQMGFSKHNFTYADPENIGRIQIINTLHSNKSSNKIIISGTLSNLKKQNLHLKLPGNRISKLDVPLELNPDGSFHFEFELDTKWGVVDVVSSDQEVPYLKLFVQPGDSIYLSADFNNLQEMSFQGKSSNSQYYINGLKKLNPIPYDPIHIPAFRQYKLIENRYSEYADLIWDYYNSPEKQKDSTKALLNLYKGQLQYPEGYLHDSYKRFVRGMVKLNSLLLPRSRDLFDWAELILIDWDLYWFKAYWTEQLLQSWPFRNSYYIDFEELYPGTPFQKQLEKLYIEKKKWQVREVLPKMKIWDHNKRVDNRKEFKKNYWGIIIANGDQQVVEELIKQAIAFNDTNNENLQFLVWSTDSKILPLLSSLIYIDNIGLLAGPDKNQELDTYLKDYEYDYLIIDPNNRIVSHDLENLQNIISWPIQKIDEEKTITLKSFIFTTFIMLTCTALIIIIIRKRNKRKETQLNRKRKIAQLEIDAVRSRMNPHFLFNALGSIQNLVNKGKNKEASLYLARFGELVRTILSQSSKSVIGLNEEIDMIRNYLHLEQLGTPFKFEINVDALIDPASIEVPPLLLQPHVENALIHGISLLGNKGLIQLNFSRDDNHLICEIVDNGPGYNAESTSQKGGLGQGWKLTRQRIQLMKEQYDEEVSVEVSSSSEKSGTTVTFRLPMQNLVV